MDRFLQTDPSQRIKLIALYLQTLTNDHQDNNNRPTPTRFQAQSEPTINIHDYLTRLINFAPIPIDGILLGLVYFERITRQENPVRVSSLTVHRLMLSTILLATKFISDRPPSRKRLAKVAGVSEHELDHLERELLTRLDFRLCWAPAELDRLTAAVLHASSPPHTAPAALAPAQPSYRASISSPILHLPSPRPPSLDPAQSRRHSSSRGIVFVKSQFIDSSILARKYGLPSLPRSSPAPDPSIDPPVALPITPTPKSSSKITVTRLEHNQIKICHTQVF